MIPPPNVTGSLHIGHALNNTLQDMLIRFQRMQGRDALWQPGTDHAGIATQMVVERQLAERGHRPPRTGPRGLHRAGLAVEGRIRRHDHPPAAPAGRLLDWPRERFTLDEGLSAAVRKVFVDPVQAGADLPRQAAGELGPEAPDRDLRSRGGEPRGRRAISGTSAIRSRAAGPVHHGRDHPARDHAGRYRGRGASRGRALPRLVGRFAILPLVGRPHSDRRRRIFRSGEGHRRGEDHAGARFQRLRGRPAPRPADASILDRAGAAS